MPFSIFVEAGDEAAASKRVWLARKKIYFFTVFSNEFADDLSPLSKVVDIEYGMVLCDKGVHAICDYLFPTTFTYYVDKVGKGRQTKALSLDITITTVNCADVVEAFVHVERKDLVMFKLDYHYYFLLKIDTSKMIVGHPLIYVTTDHE